MLRYGSLGPALYTARVRVRARFRFDSATAVVCPLVALLSHTVERFSNIIYLMISLDPPRTLVAISRFPTRVTQMHTQAHRGPGFHADANDGQMGGQWNITWTLHTLRDSI